MYRSMIIVLTLIILNLNNFTFAQWFDISYNFPNGWFSEAIDASDSLTATGPIATSTLYITTDGGASWQSVFRPSFIGDISIINSQNIWSNNLYSEIYCTTDGGSNWNLQYYNPSSTLFMNYIEMFDSLNGVAMGDAPSSVLPALILTTSNGGLDWISQNDSDLIGLVSGDTWRRIDFVDKNIGYFYANFYNGSIKGLYKTTDGGKQWKHLIDSVNCHVLKFYNENIGLIKAGTCAGGSCTPGMYRTTDGGINFEHFFIDNWDWGMDIEFVPDNPAHVWAITNTKGFFSRDTGRTWTEEFYRPDLKFIDMVFTDSNHGWLLAWPDDPYGQCKLFHTTNGGFGGIVSVDEVSEQPNKYFISQNYPNPFNPSTVIQYQIPEMSFVQLTVYDLLGREVAILINEEKQSGKYEIEFDASRLSSGVYYYQIIAGDFIQSRKMVLLR
jgi:photosystem II stability/assembly factor-like uncharacterized protein